MYIYKQIVATPVIAGYNTYVIRYSQHIHTYIQPAAVMRVFAQQVELG